MRTTVNLEPDVAKAVARIQREEGIGLSAALNRLARAGLVRQPTRSVFEQKTSDMGVRIDVTNVSEVLELLEEQDG